MASAQDSAAGGGSVRSWFLLWRILWGLAFAASLALTTVVSVRDEFATQAKHRAFMAVGFGVWWNPSATGQYGGPFGPAGYAAGIKEGDLLVALDGRPLPPDTAGRIAALDLPDGKRVALTLERADGTRYTTSVVRSSGYEAASYAGWHITFSGRRWAVFAVYLVANLAGLLAALLLFLRRPRDPVAMILSLALLVMPLTTPNIATTLPGLPGVLASIAAPLTMTLAILLFPDGRMTTRWHWIALALALVNVAYALIPAVSVAVDPLIDALLDFLPSLAVALAITMQLRATPSGAARQQIKFVLFGVIVAMLLTLLGNAIDNQMYVPHPDGLIAWMSLTKWTIFALANLAIPLGLFVSLTRYRLYDADTAITRSIAYGALTIGTLAIFAGSEKIIEVVGERYFGESLGPLAGGLGAAVAAVMVVPLHHRITHWAEHRFRSKLTHLRDYIPDLVGDLRETAVPEALAQATLDRVGGAVHAAHCAIADEDGPIATAGIDPEAARAWLAQRQPGEAQQAIEIVPGDAVFPLRVRLQADGIGGVGWLLVGPRPDGSAIGRAERAVLLQIAAPVARALAVARARGEQDRTRTRALTTLEQGLAELRRRLDDLERGPALTHPA